MDAILVAESIAQQLERRISFRRAMKQSIQRTMRSGAKGIKTSVSGRLGGAEIARQKDTAKVLFRFIHFVLILTMAQLKQHTTYGRIGVKVWIYRGEILPTKKKAAAQEGGN